MDVISYSKRIYDTAYNAFTTNRCYKHILFADIEEDGTPILDNRILVDSDDNMYMTSEDEYFITADA